MEMTLLEIVQDILNDLDSDFVNSIDDTVEAQQVAQIVKTSYYEMIGNRNWPHLRKLVQFEASGALSKPNYLRIPNGTKEVSYVVYDCRKDGETSSKEREMKYYAPEDFLRKLALRSVSDSTVEVSDFNGVKLKVINNKAPEFYTSFDDKYLVFDSFDSEVDDTLKKSKSSGLAYITPAWVHEDGAYPDLPSDAFSALLEEAKSTAFLALKQTANQKAEQKASRQQRWLSRKAWRVNGGVTYKIYGRK